MLCDDWPHWPLALRIHRWQARILLQADDADVLDENEHEALSDESVIWTDASHAAGIRRESGARRVSPGLAFRFLARRIETLGLFCTDRMQRLSLAVDDDDAAIVTSRHLAMREVARLCPAAVSCRECAVPFPPARSPLHLRRS